MYANDWKGKRKNCTIGQFEKWIDDLSVVKSNIYLQMRIYRGEERINRASPSDVPFHPATRNRCVS